MVSFLTKQCRAAVINASLWVCLQSFDAIRASVNAFSKLRVGLQRYWPAYDKLKVICILAIRRTQACMKPL